MDKIISLLREEKVKKVIGIIMYVLEAVQLLSGIAFIAYFDRMGMWPFKYLIYISVVVVIAVIASFVLRRWRWGKVVSFVISILFIVVQLLGCFYVYKTNLTLKEITDKANVNTNVISVYVMKDNSAKTIKDAREYSFGILKNMDRKNTDLTIDKINKDTNGRIKVAEYDNYLTLASALYSGKTDAIILNKAYVDVIKDFEGYKQFSEKTKVIYENEITSLKEKETKEQTTEEQTTKSFDITKDTFNVYISGIDTEGDVTTKSRSDVNIIMSVNPATRQILLLSTPRDYYVPLSISGGMKDKLTHAGLYGVDVSMNTLKMLYGIDINYYVRMNFTGFTDIINALGGINVYSQYSFNAKGFSFSEGYNQLSGDAALVFARERHSFAEGDNQRGRNQMEVIKAVIDKAQNTSLLENYTAVLDSIGDCMQTNVPTKDISKLVKMQLKSGTPWNVLSYGVSGSGQSQYTYTVQSQKAYVMEPDMETVAKAKKLLSRVKDGRKLKN